MGYDEEQIESDLVADLAVSKTKNSSNDEGQLTVDVFQNENEIVIKATIAGVGGDDIDVSITSETITIRGHRIHDEKVRSQDYYHQELYWGAFSRSIILPEEIDVDGAKATMKNGLLTIRLPKLARSRSKKIKVSY